MNHYAYTCLEIDGEQITYIVPKNIYGHYTMCLV